MRRIPIVAPLILVLLLTPSFKFAAALQHAHGGEAPVLIRIQTRAGHGGGKPTKMRIEEVADQWAFLVHTLDMKVPSGRSARSAAVGSRSSR